VQSVRIYRFGGLDRWRHGRSRGSPARLAGRTCLDRLVDLDDRAQPVAAGADHRGAVAMQHRPRGLLGADPEYTLQPESGDPVLLARHLPHRHEPHRQRRSGAMERWCPPSVRRDDRTVHMTTDRPAASTPAHPRTAGTGSSPASATSPGSPGTPGHPGASSACQRRSRGSRPMPWAPRGTLPGLLH